MKFKKWLYGTLLPIAVVAPVAAVVACGNKTSDSSYGEYVEKLPVGFFNEQPDLNIIFPQRGVSLSSSGILDYHIIGKDSSILTRGGQTYVFNVPSSTVRGFYKTAPLYNQKPDISLTSLEAEPQVGDKIDSTTTLSPIPYPGKFGEELFGFSTVMSLQAGSTPSYNFNSYDTPNGTEYYKNGELYVVWWTTTNGEELNNPGLFKAEFQYDASHPIKERAAASIVKRTRPTRIDQQPDLYTLQSAENGATGKINGRDVKFLRRDTSVAANKLYGGGLPFDTRNWYEAKTSIKDQFSAPSGVFINNDLAGWDRDTKLEQDTSVSTNSYLTINGKKYYYNTGFRSPLGKYVFTEGASRLNQSAYTTSFPESKDTPNVLAKLMGTGDDWKTNPDSLKNLEEEGWDIKIYGIKNPFNSLLSEIAYSYIDKDQIINGANAIESYKLQKAGWYITAQTVDANNKTSLNIIGSDLDPNTGNQIPFTNKQILDQMSEGTQIIRRNGNTITNIYTLYNTYLDQSQSIEPGFYAEDDLWSVVKQNKPSIVNPILVNKNDRIVITTHFEAYVCRDREFTFKNDPLLNDVMRRYQAQQGRR